MGARDELFLASITAMAERRKAEGVAGRGQMSVGELAATLRAAPDLPVMAGGYAYGVGDVDSYRGYYSDLAIEPGGDATAHQLAGALDAAVGATFTGYKGGDFVMSRVTPVWVSPYGDASGLAVTGVNVEEGRVVLVLTKEEW